MAMIEKQEFCSLMVGLRLCYPNALRDEGQWLGTLSTYWSKIRRYEAQAVRRGFDMAWRTHAAWFPSAGQLVALIEEGAAPPRLKAINAWDEVVGIAGGNGKKHTDPIAQQAIDAMGGAQALGRMQENEFRTWGRKRFEDIYAQLTQAMTQGETVSSGSEAVDLPPAVRELVGKVVDASGDS